MSWVEVAQGIESFATAGALVVGGAWAYGRFVHARKIWPQLGLQITGGHVDLPSGSGIRVRISVENRGSAVVRVDNANSGVAIFAGKAETTHFRWKDVSAFETLATHSLIEPGESIVEEHLVPFPCRPRVPLRLFFYLQNRPVMFNASAWSTEQILLPGEGMSDATQHGR